MADREIRDTIEADLEAVTAIYAQEVLQRTATYETEPPSVHETRRRWMALRAAGYPHVVACLGGAIAGYAYASAYRTREGYRWTVEDSVYVDPRFQRRGVGRILLSSLVDRCTTLGYRQMVAVIGDGTNAGSIALHEALGFRVAARFPGLGWKHGRWLENVQMIRALGEGDRSPPSLPRRA